jgi:hypothetical protein
MMFKFNLTYVALAAALSSSFVYADPNTWVVQNHPVAADVKITVHIVRYASRVRFFNINNGCAGMILNNSGDDLTHDKFGNIARNNNLTNGSASVIPKSSRCCRR